MAKVMPKHVKWLKAVVAGFEPGRNQVVLGGGERVGYRSLLVSPGIELHWDVVEGLRDTLGRNGVTSNYTRSRSRRTRFRGVQSTCPRWHPTPGSWCRRCAAARRCSPSSRPCRSSARPGVGSNVRHMASPGDLWATAELL